MRRRYSAPRDPETLGGIVAILRILAGERPPETALETSVVDALNRRGADPIMARKMLANVAATPKAARERLLGDAIAPAFRAEAAPRSGTEPSSEATVTVPYRVFADRAETTGTRATTLSEGGGDPPPVYTIRYQGLFCQEETDWDRFSNSDEIYVVTTAIHIAADGTNVIRAEHHPAHDPGATYDDVDTGEERVGPVAAAWQGSANPMSLVVVVMEHDDGDPDEYKETIRTLVDIAVEYLKQRYPWLSFLDKLKGTITDAINYILGSGDDPLETQTVILPRELLDSYTAHAPTLYIGTRTRLVAGPFGRPQVVSEPFSSHILYHFATSHGGGGARYIVCFDVVRDPSNEIPPIIL